MILRSESTFVGRALRQPSRRVATDAVALQFLETAA